MSIRLFASSLLAAFTLLTTVCPAADSWPTFRGSGRTAVSPEKSLLQEWPSAGPALAWEASGAGRGYSSLAIAGGKIYTLGDGPSTAEDKDEYLLCFNQADGKPLWKTKTGKAWTNGQENWQSSRSTPTVDGSSVYILTAHADLIACDANDGHELWRKNLKSDFGGKKGDNWGYSESVLIDGDRLICTPGGSSATMVALDKKTGETIWKSPLADDRGAGHASIVIAEIGGTKVYVQTTASGALGARASDGEKLWHYPIDKTTAVIPTPIVRGDLVFFAAGYKRGGALLKQKAVGDGKVEVEEIFPINSALANKHGGIVLVGEYLYGDSDDQGIPWCADLMTGEIKWKKRGSGKKSASFVAADDRLYIRFADGTMVLAKATPEDYIEVSSFKIPGGGERPSWSHPVIVDGKLYLREQDKIFCYDISKKS
ncbi:Outer membrane protein assembly factor BamB precursor [Anatilimnocola aggregata]|uniref:Outer membrane protein assembly factor BamB n=1 Tax=Anatilimnocola aggregata TaxID=2528021 RepID=A0A517Y7W5_9BACT|nr:PQQ-binding-like beta-propeller repeat protein [Anatilimnocola aggregata]QDU26323.1 Outer membrane protein assembly factor BamB precursor [Anatilimnocola aggregata]